MYYDLVASLPHLPHFDLAGHLPVTRLRLDQRLRLLRTGHRDQLARAESLVRWRLDPQRWRADAAQLEECAALLASPLDPSLREYVAFRIDQQTLLAALRRKQEGAASLNGVGRWDAVPRARHIQTHWDEPDFGLAPLVPWLPDAREFLAAGDARRLERLLMNVAWRRLGRHAEQNTFGFEAVFAYFFRWDILRAWLSSDPEKGKTRFRELIDQVTHVEYS